MSTKQVLKSWLDPWLWRMAWRDSRRQRRRLLIFTASMVIGVGALVAIQSFQHDLRLAINSQAKELLGADLMVRSRTGFPAEVQQVLERSQAVARSSETSFATMIYFPKTGASRLVQVRALAGAFPYYGELETAPAEAAEAFRQGTNALVDESLMLQYEAEVGDTIRLGEATFTIAGRLVKVPGESPMMTQMSPRVFIPLDQVAATGLIRTGSRVRYYEYFQFDDADRLAAVAQRLEALEPVHGFRARTVEESQERLGRNMRNIDRFLNLFGIAALLLGGIGVGSAMHVYMRQKIDSVAILRCLGATATQTTGIYAIQALILGLLGSLLGVLAGLGIQRLLPLALGAFIPAELQVSLAWGAVALGLLVGTGFTLVFALLPLLSIRRVSPLRALRADLEHLPPSLRDPARLFILVIMGLALAGLASLAMRSFLHGAAITAALLLLFGVLAGLALLLMRLVRRLVPRRLPFVVRQGLNNLHRPHNQTGTLMLSLGLGTFLIATLFLTQEVMLSQVDTSRHDDAPNLAMFDIQPDQLSDLQQILRDHEVPVQPPVPLITMRISSINGKSVSELREQEEPDLENWSLNREYRSTYRDYLVEGEKLLSGDFISSVEPDWNWGTEEKPIPVTIERELADESLRVTLGDRITWDVQGLPLVTEIVGMREVDWFQLQPNFFFIFPAGVLEEAPQIFVQTTRVPSTEVQASVQRQVVERLPNISIIDVSLVIDTLDRIFNRIAFAVRFLSMFSIITGVIVLIGSVSTSRYQRIREHVLLRTLGASRGQILAISVTEFVLLGSFAALTGIGLAVIASWSLAIYLFEVRWIWEAWPLVFIWLAISGLTVLIGMANNLGAFRRPPLEVLRQQAE